MLGAAHSSLRLLPADPGQHPTPSLASAEGFASLYRTYAASVYAAAYRVLGRAGEAEDVMQEVFTRLWRDPNRFDPARGEIGSYLRVMARSRALDLWRQEQAAGRARDRLKVVGRNETRVDDGPARAAEHDDDHDAVIAALKHLPPEQREALVLSYWGSLSAHEIAQHAGVPFGTARSRMRLGLERMRSECADSLAEARASD